MFMHQAEGSDSHTQASSLIYEHGYQQEDA